MCSSGYTFFIEVNNMNLKLELIANALADDIKDHLNYLEESGKINTKKIADTKATKVLAEIQNVLGREELDDFYKIEKIVNIFEKHKISAKGCHDF